MFVLLESLEHPPEIDYYTYAYYLQDLFYTRYMKSVLFGIFAHPDDEAFGPCGYLIQAVQDGTDVHLICATDGGAGQGDGEIRIKELQKSTDVIGAKSSSLLGFRDGDLDNNNFKQLETKIRETVINALSRYEEDAEISFVTFEPNGLTGHLDHIAVSFAVTYVFTHSDMWLPQASSLKSLKYFCLCDAQKAEDLNYFIYSPKGHPEEEVDETVDVTNVLDTKKAAIRAHASQEDHKRILEINDHLLCNEHFMLYKH